MTLELELLQSLLKASEQMREAQLYYFRNMNNDNLDRLKLLETAKSKEKAFDAKLKQVKEAITVNPQSKLF